jgi:HTH-type transcriptional regulator, transcriptional repressor of NAD biosynthesis genes
MAGAAGALRGNDPDWKGGGSGMKSAHGLVIGKFYPPHDGHHFLIRTAAAVSARVTVVVMAATHEALPLEKRVAWLQAAHRDLHHVQVVGIQDDVPVDYDDANLWRQHVGLMREALQKSDAGPVTAVFTSEPYGAELARHFNAKPVTVDLSRDSIPISGTLVRGDPVRYWHHLEGPVRAGLARRVIVVGAESTGTTTLSQSLADYWRRQGQPHHETRWIGEYGRAFTVDKLAQARAQAQLDGRPVPGMRDLVWATDEFVHIAEVQTAWEGEAASHGGPLLICDTDALATAIWHERYVGTEAPAVLDIAMARQPALYLVTNHEGVPFEQDGVRDGEHIRAWMTERFLDVLKERGLNYQLMNGPPAERLRMAIKATAGLFAEPWPMLTESRAAPEVKLRA